MYVQTTKVIYARFRMTFTLSSQEMNQGYATDPGPHW